MMLEQQLQKRTIDLEGFRTAMGADERLLKMANYDPLTGLPNRDLFYTTLQMGLTQAALRGWQLAVVTVGLNDFKNINPDLGPSDGRSGVGRVQPAPVQLPECQ